MSGATCRVIFDRYGTVGSYRLHVRAWRWEASLGFGAYDGDVMEWLVTETGWPELFQKVIRHERQLLGNLEPSAGCHAWPPYTGLGPPKLSDGDILSMGVHKFDELEELFKLFEKTH